ncbi:hypothetical protein Q7514_13380 [Rhodococcus artemisiae]|uniref:Uncharacterized protein n=1 Tax=Rhodococcus artemisiae TaxID=714159 RepID=A0ABU7LAD9_9NOCA|nr:hypothetical protein [Rhodococcus artemisiae]
MNSKPPLMNRLEAFLLELSHGFAFAGRLYHFSVDGDDFHIDLTPTPAPPPHWQWRTPATTPCPTRSANSACPAAV